MLILLWLVLCLAGVSVLLLPLVLWRLEIFKRYSSSRLVACPENQQSVTVSIDTRHAAETGIDGCPELRLSDCTRWPERASCDQACLSKAAQAGPYTAGEVKVSTKQIYHLPIVLAAFAAWCVGALWHSQFMFRAQWTQDVGLTRAEVKQMVWWVWPHLLTFGVCLLFAYGVAWLLALCHCKGVLQGVIMAALLCAPLVLVGWYAIARLPHELLAMEMGYAALATLIVGAVVGGLYNKPVLRSR